MTTLWNPEDGHYDRLMGLIAEQPQVSPSTLDRVDLVMRNPSQVLSWDMGRKTGAIMSLMSEVLRENG